METLQLNAKIYKLEAVKKAVAEFKELATIKVAEQGEYITVEFSEIDQAYGGIIKDEFANYVLGLMS